MTRALALVALIVCSCATERRGSIRHSIAMELSWCVRTCPSPLLLHDWCYEPAKRQCEAAHLETLCGEDELYFAPHALEPFALHGARP